MTEGKNGSIATDRDIGNHKTIGEQGKKGSTATDRDIGNYKTIGEQGKKGSTATDWDMTNYKIINEEGKKTFIFNTSGSTGEPKIIEKSYECVLKEGQDLAKLFNFSDDTVFVSTVNSDYMYGTTFTVMLPRVLGCVVDGERVLYPEDIKDYENYVFVSTPSFLEKLAKYNFKFKRKPKMIFSAGAPLNDELFEYLQGISEAVTEIYGSTEAGVIAYRQFAKDNLRFFENVHYYDGKISSPYFDEDELELSDELEFLDDGFWVKGRKDRIVKIQEKRISLNEIENILNSDEFIEKSYCLKLDDKLCAAVVLNEKGRKFLEENGKLELVKKIKNSWIASHTLAMTKYERVLPKKWRFLYDLPVNERGKTDLARIKEIFNTNVTYPYVIDFNINGDNAYLDLIFPKNSNFFEGHFPQMPILPGVVQLFFAKEFIKDVFHLDFVPQKVKKVKFSSIIKPDMKVRLTLCKTDKSVEYKFTKDEVIFSSGTFVL